MSRGDKSSYTAAQKRKAQHIEESYEARGLSEKEAAARAWATVNKQSGGGEKSGSGRSTSASAKKAARKSSAKRAAATRKRRSAGHRKTQAAG
jgi:plasmid stabilization system protein ParE